MRNTLILIGLLIGPLLLAQSYEEYNGDTINLTDINNKKQGLWVKFDSDNKTILEQGHYVSNKKNGLWMSYYSNGKKKHQITYQKGKAIGPACFYYDNGLISEEGHWHIDHWQGNYKFYNTTGSLAYDWNYDNEGKRTGSQKYYHDNGTLKYTGDWQAGKAIGTLKVFDKTGKLITERVYNDGKFKENIAITEDIKTDEIAPKQELAQNNTSTFKGTGRHTVYNLHGKIEEKGFFVNGKLFDGQHFFYDNNNKITKIIHYKNGNLIKTEEH